MKQMVEWTLEAWGILPDEIMDTKHGPYTELPGNTEPVEGFQEENVCIEDIPGLPFGSDDSDQDSIVY